MSALDYIVLFGGGFVLTVGLWTIASVVGDIIRDLGRPDVWDEEWRQPEWERRP